MRVWLTVVAIGACTWSGSACRARPADAANPQEQETVPVRVPEREPARPSDATVRPTACALMNQEEMSRLLGGAVGPPVEDERGNSTMCTYTPASGKGLTPYAQVKVAWHGGEAAMTGVRLADRLISKDAGFSIVDKIDGVGDEATMMIGGVMNVRRGEIVLTIDLRMQPRAKQKGIAIAKTLLAHIDERANRAEVH